LASIGSGLLLITSVSGPADAFGCTIVMAARTGLVLAGNNEDRDHRNLKEVVAMDLAEELEKGQRRLELGSLFKSRAQG